jgi:two-component system, chemotaxis family, response regulator Rcp1
MKPVKVLLVEDNQSDVYLVKESLRECLFPVELVVAQDGAIAISMIGESNFEVDLIVLDLNIPKEDGYAVMEKIGRAGPPVVVFATSVLEGERAVALGAREVIEKPNQLRPFIQTFCHIVQKWANPREN